jgi:hypothetical protein
VFVVVVVVVVVEGLCIAGALFQPPKSSSAVIVVSFGFVLFVFEPHPPSIGSGFIVVGAIVEAGSEAPHTFDEPQASSPDPKLENPDEDG